ARDPTETERPTPRPPAATRSKRKPNNRSFVRPRPPTAGTIARPARGSLLQGRKVRRTCRRKLQTDTVDDNPHHEHRDEQVQQHSNLNQERHRLQQQEAEYENPVLEHQVAEYLRDRLAPS